MSEKAAASFGGLKRELRLLDILCLGLNAIIGSGIFLFPGKLAAFLGPASILSFFLCGILLIPIALCFAYLAARYESTGGTYLYARDAFGPWTGFAVGWMAWVVLIVSYAAVANAISAYLGHFSPFFGTRLGTKAVALGVIAGLGVLNYVGVVPAARTTDAFTAAKLVPLLIFVAVGLFAVRWENLTPFAPHGFGSFGPAVFLVWFAYQGFENAPVPSGEAARPRRDAPLAVVLSLLLSGVLYVLVQTVAVGTHPGVAGSSKPLAEAAGVFLGPWGAGLIALGAAISTLGFTTGAALVTPRYLYALAADGYLPGILGSAHPRFGTPHAAVVATTLAAGAAALVLDFDKLVDLSNVTVGVQYVATCASAWVLVRMPGGPALPLAGMGVVAYLTWQARLPEWLWTLAALGVGLALAAGYRRLCRKP